MISRQITEKQKKIIGAVAIAVFLIFFGLVSWFIGRPMLRFVEEPEQFRLWVEGHGFFGKLAFIGMMVLQVVVAVIPGEPLEIGAGYAFGAWQGAFLCLIGAVLGGVIVFLFVRYWGVKVVEIFFPQEKIQSLKFLQNSKKLNLITFIIFLIPGTPKDLLCYFVGLTDMKLSVWILITAIARIPSVITSTIGGNALGLQNYQFAVVVFAVTLCISLGGLLVYRAICTHHEKHTKSTKGE